MMGQEVNATMGGKVDGEITVDIKTGALIRNSTVTQMDNSIEVMGMTVSGYRYRWLYCKL